MTRMGVGAFGYIPLARVRRWTFLVTDSDDRLPTTKADLLMKLSFSPLFFVFVSPFKEMHI